MRRFWTFSLLSIIISPIALFAQEWALDADIELAGHYEWQGLQLDPGRTIQHAVYGSRAHSSANSASPGAHLSTAVPS